MTIWPSTWWGWVLGCLVILAACWRTFAAALTSLRMGRSDHQRDHEALRRESTRDPIFLLQERVPVWSGAICENAIYDHEAEGFVNDDGQELTSAEAIEAGAGTWVWRTITVFLTRSEGEEWAAARAYRYSHGTRIWCVAAEGALCRALAEATIDGRYS